MDPRLQHHESQYSSAPNFSLNVRCFARLQHLGHSGSSGSVTEALYFEHDLLQRPLQEGADVIEQLGPVFFSRFLNHQFFINVFRPLAVGDALVNRRELFLSSTEWNSTPWQFYPKDDFDRLIDLMVLLPPLLARIDQTIPAETAPEPRSSEESLLQNLYTLEASLAEWYQESFENHALPYRMHDSNGYSFKDDRSGVAFLYYWMTRLLLGQEIETLRFAISWQAGPEHHSVDQGISPSQQDICHTAANDICRGLGSLLNMLQSELLATPMKVAMCYFQVTSMGAKFIPQEIMWLESFYQRLTQVREFKGYALTRQGWTEIAQL
ncbi:C6 zinc finger domain-containing [Fusarium albosuccineum]|uniref:C6 zinc finger domain-containing n=1 Tax=Fusarium albosuccineum TaxID=1237068 RepID=A0A8H4L8K3_9HYPO|nr:C6 zinc finger domain-containing [Fusarium albosuccineum]